MTRIAIADDSLLIRQGLVGLLEMLDDVQVAAECGDVAELYEVVDRQAIDVVITDIRMPPTHTCEGIDAARTLKLSHPDLGIIVLSQFSEPEYVSALFQDGSAGLGYLLKERLGDLDQLDGAIQSVRSGGSALDPKIVELMLHGDSGHPGVVGLSPRETDVLALIAEGLSNTTIAERLVLTPKAVSKHINSIFSKLGLSADPTSDSRVRAVLLWLAAQ